MFKLFIVAAFVFGCEPIEADKVHRLLMDVDCTKVKVDGTPCVICDGKRYDLSISCDWSNN